MSTPSRPQDGEPQAHHSDDVLFPSGRGHVAVFLGKEALLAWFSDVRSDVHEDVVDRFYALGRRRASFTASTCQLVETVTTVRYDGSSKAVVDLCDRIAALQSRA